MTDASGTTPVAIVIAALGGEGGGVLAEWLVQCGIRAGLPIQATSVPGVAQRTGSTSYYIELLPQPLPPGSPRPVFALTPVPGRVDVLVASEAVEAGRMMERGFVRPDRTLLIASTHRVYTTAEKMHMADGRYDTNRVVTAGGQLAREAVFMDMEAIAARHQGMRVLGISCITNFAAGMTGENINHEEVMETGARVAEVFKELLRRVIARI